MRESAIQDEIRLALSPYGVVLRLNNGQFYTKDGRVVRSGLPNGTSDLLFVGHGTIAFIEVKRPGEKPRPEQVNFFKQMHKLGHAAGVAHSAAEALHIIGEGENHAV